jgi:hydroxyethylthiazole kinase-like uncharacterized protein yjeF
LAPKNSVKNLRKEALLMDKQTSAHATRIYLTSQIREFESIARQRFSFSNADMMGRAGEAALNYLLSAWPHAKKIMVVCGPGNNGGDGYVLAHLALARGLAVTLWLAGDPEKLQDAAKEAYENCLRAGIPMLACHDEVYLSENDVVVDAIYGIGLHGAVQVDGCHVIAAINDCQVPVLALDVPSGLDADTGAALGAAIKATATITFIGMKLGLLTGNGAEYTGTLYCDNLNLPAEIFSLIDTKIEKMQISQFAKYLEPRPRAMNKGLAGHVLIVGGDAGHSGAPLMAAMAALRVGAGLVTIATHPSHAAVLNLTCPEIMCQGVRAVSSLRKLLSKATVVIVGPGLGQSPWAKRLLAAVFASKHPLVVDADGLNLLAKHPVMRRDWILTPHPGEAARLLDVKTPEIQADRLLALHKLQQRYDGVVVLKGAGTLVLGSHCLPALCDAGNPGMASGGMGDVLSGVIGGLVAQGVPLVDAAKLGVWLHAEAGDCVAAENGERGLMATDLLLYLQLLVNPEL